MLATKYRPKRFADIVGQTAPVMVLTQMVARDMVPAALVFCGRRGCGKTSMARILARAKNCEDRLPGYGDSCGQCGSCQAVDQGRAMFLVEVDAASSGGVDSMRAIIEDAQYSAGGNHKIIILDEVHAATSQGFQVLLKTLEEPPPRVTFVLVTTEPDKIPATIMTRSMMCRFGKIPPSDVRRRLKDVADAEGIAADEEVLDWIVDYADGGMRDALMVLDQAATALRQVTTDGLIRMFGDRRVTKWLQMVWSNNLAGAVLEADDLCAEAGAAAVIDRAILELRDVLLGGQVGSWRPAEAAEVIPKLWKMAVEVRRLGPDERAAMCALSAEIAGYFADQRRPLVRSNKVKPSRPTSIANESDLDAILKSHAET